LRQDTFFTPNEAGRPAVHDHDLGNCACAVACGGSYTPQAR
jgi:hypothetical protein